jgi:hypothetical protein
VVVSVRVEESSMPFGRVKAKPKECEGKTRGKTAATVLLIVCQMEELAADTQI